MARLLIITHPTASGKKPFVAAGMGVGVTIREQHILAISIGEGGDIDAAME